MPMLFKIGTYIGAALIGLLAWNFAIRAFLDQTVNSPSAKAEGEFFRMEREAQVKYAGPGTNTAAAISRYASEQAAKVLAAAPAGDERAFTAAQIFAGFYLTNTRARVEYCREQKVDIASFANAVSARHRAQVERAEALFRAHGTSIDETWPTVRASLKHAVELDMQATIGFEISTPAKACEEIAHRPQTFAEQLDFARREHAIDRALMER